MRLLTLDIGGSNVKVWQPHARSALKIPSGAGFTPDRLMEELHPLIENLQYDAVSIGYPGTVIDGRPTRDPFQLGVGWEKYDFCRCFNRPVRIMNDAALQALGAYTGGRMLFLGLGTCVGSTLIADNCVVPLELGNLPHFFGRTFEDLLERRYLDQAGRPKWSRAVLDAVPRVRNAFVADYVVLGGGNAKKLQVELPNDVRVGGNHDVALGGLRLWQSRALGSVHVFDPKAEPALTAA